MPTLIGNKLNEVIVARWSQTDFAVIGAEPFLAVDIPNNPNGLSVSSIEFGTDAFGAGAPDIEFLVAMMLLDASLDPARSLSAQILDGPGAMSPPTGPAKFRRPYMRVALGPGPFDRADHFTEPIPVPAGSRCTVALAVWQALTTPQLINFHLCVRGRDTAIAGGPRYRKY